MRTAKTLLMSLLAVLALSAVAAGAVQAAPSWFVEGKEFGSGSKAAITATSGVSRLWSTSLGIAIVCKKDAVSGGELIGGGPGTDKATSVTFTECAIFEAVKNATSKKWEVGKELTACTVKSPGAAAKEIVTKELKSTLAYYPGTAKAYIVDYLEPVKQPFVEIEVAGSLCAAKLTAAVEGSVIAGTFPHEGVELPTGYLGFTVHETGAGEMVNLPEEYEEASGKKAKDTLTFDKKTTGLESMEAVELTSGKSFAAGGPPREPVWTLKGVPIVAEQSVTAVEVSPFRINIARPKTTITCSRVKLNGGKILPGMPGKDKATSIEWFAPTGCTVEETPEVQKECAVKEPITTNEVSSRLFYLSPTEVGDVWTPATAGAFMKLELIGANCTAKGPMTINGSLIGEVTPVGGEHARLMMKFLEPPIERVIEGATYGKLTNAGGAVESRGTFELERGGESFGVE